MRRILIAALTLSCLVFSAAEQTNAEQIFALAQQPIAATGGQSIFSFDSATPGTVSAAQAITGLRANDSLTGIDFRPANGQLYGVGFSGGIYTINTTTGAASLVSILNTPLVFGNATGGIDFNPTVDRLRFVNLDDQNLRINVDTGEAIVDGTLRYAAGDVSAGINPAVIGSAYTNNFAGATSTTLYNLEFGADPGALVTQLPPNDGILNTVGSLGASSGSAAGFDISGVTGAGYAVFSTDISRLYTINLSTGAATLVGPIGGGLVVTGIAAPVGAPIPEPATLVLLGTGLAGVAAARRRRRIKAGTGE